MRKIRLLSRSAVLLSILASGNACADSVQEALRMAVEQISETGRLSAADYRLAAVPDVVRFYEARAFELAWTRDGKPAQVLEALYESRREGLNPDDYDVSAIAAAADRYRANRELNARQLAAMDILMTDSLIRLARHLRFGRVDPTGLYAHWNFRRGDFGPDPLTVLQRAVDAPAAAEFFGEYLRRGPIYEAMREALARYRDIAASGGWPPVPEGPTLRHGMSDSRVPVLAKRLAISGDLPGTAVDPVSFRYTTAIEDGVRLFQLRHGIDVDGQVGPATLRALNVPAAERVGQLRVNLERARWLLNNLDDQLIVVNVAGFRAYLMRNGEIVWETNVQVGNVVTPTPIFRDSMTYLVINPTWTVPYSIATQELLPRIRDNPDYLAVNDYDLVDRNGNAVDPADVDWLRTSARSFPYTIVQRPGPANALGRVKFMFPNEHAVCLHDTPARSLFERAGRAFSHGCIRVQNPLELALLLLEPQGWDRRRIERAVASGKTKTVPLSDALPVLILYWTAAVDLADGTVRFYEDLYNRDPALLAALDAPLSPAVR